jgi:hypothetical protein
MKAGFAHDMHSSITTSVPGGEISLEQLAFLDVLNQKCVNDPNVPMKRTLLTFNESDLPFEVLNHIPAINIRKDIFVIAKHPLEPPVVGDEIAMRQHVDQEFIETDVSVFQERD